MSRTIAVMIPQLEENHRERIRKEAEGYGVETVFPKTAEETEQALKEAEIILGQSGEYSRKAPKLQWICTPSAGVDQFLGKDAFANPGAMLTNSSGAYGVTIAEHVVMVTLEMMRRRSEYNEIVRERKWERELPIHSIRGSRITFLGTGDIGQECAKRMRGFEPAVMTGVNRSGKNPGGCFDRVMTADRLEEILPETDLLILSLPATAETRGILGARQLGLMPETARIVNVGRGSAVDQKALEGMLREGKLAGAALDVFETEPIPKEDSLWECPRLLITPHIAGNMTLDYTVERIVEQFLEDLGNYAERKPLRHLVDRERGY